MGFRTRSIHAGQGSDPATGAVNVPIYLSSTYAQDGIGEDRGWEYSRSGNPTRAALEQCMAELEGGVAGFAFASGLAAIDAVMRLVKAGEHVVAGDDMYGGTFRLFDTISRPAGVVFTYVDMRDADAIRQAIRDETRMLYVETPTNPMMRLYDLSLLGEIAREANIPLVVDNTFATPYLQSPIEHGASIVLHSATKYLGGHSDLIGGIVVVDSGELAERIGFFQNSCGGILGIPDSYLLLRSIKTLPVRMDQHCANAERIAEHLTDSGAFGSVLFPGLESFPQLELAKRQMRGPGGMISADIGSFEAAAEFARNVSLITFGESLGGVESLLCHPASMTHGSVPEETRQRLGITPGLLRFSVGLEDVDDLIQDIDLALGNVSVPMPAETAR